jgi:hypothetical protein
MHCQSELGNIEQKINYHTIPVKKKFINTIIISKVFKHGSGSYSE